MASLTLPYADRFYSALYNAQLGNHHLDALKQEAFHTHSTWISEKLHAFTEALLFPGRFNMQMLGKSFEPSPGGGKDSYLNPIYRITYFVLWILSIPLAVFVLVLAAPLRAFEHLHRHAISFIDYSKHSPGKTPDALFLSQEHPLHIRTHNLGFVTTGLSTAGDLRDPAERASDLVDDLMTDDQAPEIIFFQEAFHEDATKVLCEGIKTKYPYIVHSIAPQISYFNSGAMVASQYPIEEIYFERFDHMLGPEMLAPRGILRIKILSPKGPLFCYNVHTQALMGEERALSRVLQMQDVKKLMDKDLKENPQARQILVGDFNTSHYTVWGESNLHPSNQAESRVITYLEETFDDLFLKDHDTAGKRLDGTTPIFLEKDNQRIGKRLKEPTGSWYRGPFADPGYALAAKMKFDRERNGRPVPDAKKSIPLPPNVWGTKKWYDSQETTNARLDYILLLKESNLDGRVEIRRSVVPKARQSGLSDHLAVDALIWERIA